jgi:hypothetical protein
MEIERTSQLPFGVLEPLGFHEILREGGFPKGSYCASCQHIRRLKSI